MSAAVSNVNPSRLEAEQRACESLAGSVLPRELAMIVAAYVPELFEGLALFHDLTRCEFFRKEWPNVQEFQKAVTVAKDKDSRGWFVFTCEGFSLAEGNLFCFYQIRFLESTQEYECVAKKYDEPIQWLHKNEDEKDKNQKANAAIELVNLTGRYPNAEALANALSEF